MTYDPSALQLYYYLDLGRTASIVLFMDTWHPSGVRLYDRASPG